MKFSMLGKLAFIFSLFIINPIFGQYSLEKDKELLIVAREYAVNILDIQNTKASQGARVVACNCYDRLVTFGKKKLPNGLISYDFNKIEPELAESWFYDKDGTSLIFKLRKDAKFHDGSPVTAQDVKWSFDRAVTVGGPLGFSTVQMNAGGLKKPEQFIVLDDYTFKIQLLEKDKTTLPDLAVPIPSIYNSKLAKAHATEKDPWATEWLSSHDAGGGAFRVESFIPGIEIVFTRFDEWKSGPLPKLKKVIEKAVPSVEFRKSLFDLKEIDIAFELTPEIADQLSKNEGVQTISDPIENALFFLDMNVTKIPFDNIKIRKAIAYAIPYEEIYNRVALKRGEKLFGGKFETTRLDWPQPFPYYTDLNKAKELLSEAGFANGFNSELYINMGTYSSSELTAQLIQENLKKININIRIKKILDINWRSEFSKKEMPMLINNFSGWLIFPDYFFFWNYHSQNNIFNTMSYQNPEMDSLIENALKAKDEKTYEKNVRAFITKAKEDVPRIPLFQMYLDLALQKNVHGYVYWFHRQIDYRTIYKD